MSEFEYSNGADGTCQSCGEPTDEEHHALCRSCYAEEQGWPGRRYRPDPGSLRAQHEQRERVTVTRLLERIGDLERRVAELEQGREAA